jgi:hypothetical protein
MKPLLFNWNLDELSETIYFGLYMLNVSHLSSGNLTPNKKGGWVGGAKRVDAPYDEYEFEEVYETAEGAAYAAEVSFNLLIQNDIKKAEQKSDEATLFFEWFCENKAATYDSLIDLARKTKRDEIANMLLAFSPFWSNPANAGKTRP